MPRPKRGYTAGFKQKAVELSYARGNAADGIPVGMYLVQDARHDSQILKRMYHGPPPESSLYGDSGYTDYEIEDMLLETEQAKLMTSRKRNLKRKDIPAVAFYGKAHRNVRKPDLRIDAKAYQCGNDQWVYHQTDTACDGVSVRQKNFKIGNSG